MSAERDAAFLRAGGGHVTRRRAFDAGYEAALRRVNEVISRHWGEPAGMSATVVELVDLMGRELPKAVER